MSDIIKLVTFNLRYIWKSDGINSFIHRAGLIFEKIGIEKPDIIAFQEVTEQNLDFLRRMLAEYYFVGQFRNEDYQGEGLYMAVRRDRLHILAFEGYWLSPTPYISGSRYENQSECPRVCIAVKIRDEKSGKIFRVMNIHLDHISDEARIEGMECVLTKLEEYNQKVMLPFIIAGDFNAYPDSDVIKKCTEYKKYPMKDITKNIKATFHGFCNKKEKIDYIYTSSSIEKCITEVGIWDECNEGIYLSDHYPVFMNFDISKI